MRVRSLSLAKSAETSRPAVGVDIRSDGSLTGDVIAARISIEDGAFFKGGIDIRKGGQPQQQKANGEDKSVPATPATEPAAVGARA